MVLYRLRAPSAEASLPAPAHVSRLAVVGISADDAESHGTSLNSFSGPTRTCLITRLGCSRFTSISLFSLLFEIGVRGASFQVG